MRVPSDLWAELFDDVNHQRHDVATVRDLSNTQWRIERLGRRTAREGFAAAASDDGV